MNKEQVIMEILLEPIDCIQGMRNGKHGMCWHLTEPCAKKLASQIYDLAHSQIIEELSKTVMDGL
jgi:hypothetical protein